MEDEKKRKKNKKKKGKQTKNSDAAVNGGESASVEQNHIPIVEQNNGKQTSGTTDVQASGALESDAKLDRHHTDKAGDEGTCDDVDILISQLDMLVANECQLSQAHVYETDHVFDLLEKVIVDEATEKQLWLQREKCLEDEIKEVHLAKHSWTLKEETLEDIIKQLQSENDSCVQRVANLEENTKRLQIEKDSFIQREGGLEKEMMDLQNQKHSWLQKEADLGDKINLLESDKESLVLKENSTNEKLARLYEDNMKLQNKVKELEASRDQLLQENQRLMETVSLLQLQIQNFMNNSSSHASSTTEMVQHVPKDGDANAQMEVANALVEKMVKENAQLADKVNDHYVELDQRNPTAVNSSISTLDSTEVMPKTSTAADYVSELSVRVPEFSERMSLRGIQNEDKVVSSDHADLESIAVSEVQIEEPTGSYEAESDETEEIVQVPLHDNEITDLESQAAETDEKSGVPLTDAPLIGAPFRLISFFAKYVSGADLVSKNASGR